MCKNYVEKRLRIYEDGDLEIHCITGNTERVLVTVSSVETCELGQPRKKMTYKDMVDLGRDEGWFDRQDVEIFERVFTGMKI